MMENVDSKRERSALYPVMTVEECFETVKVIDSLGGKVYSSGAIAKALNMSEKTNAFRAKLSTLKQYGLIQGTQNTYKLTEISNQYLYPIEDKQKKESMLAAFSCVSLYKKIVEKYENQALPTQERLANLLLSKEYGLTKNTKDIAAELFLTSLQQLGLLVNGILVIGNIEKAFDEESANRNNNFEESEVQKKEVLETREREVVEKKYCFEIPMLSGEATKIVIPTSVTERDLDFIQMYVETMMPAFISNLRETKK